MKDITERKKTVAKKSKKKKIVGSSFLLLLVLVLVGVYVIAIFSRSPSLVIASDVYTQNTSQTKSLVLDWPAGTESALGVSGYGLVASYGTQTATPTASIAKLMTALAVLSKYPLNLGQSGPTITISASDVASYQAYLAEDGSVVKVTAGEQISEYQALQAMLLPSADNIADTLAQWAFGSIDSYTSFANQYASKIGLTHSVFSDASGFSPSTVSTPEDLITLGETALNNPVIAQIVDQATATIPVAGVVQNVDWTLGEDGIIGIKTGNTTQAGGCFLFAAKQKFANGQSITLVGAVMKDSSLLTALDNSVTLLKSAENQIVLKTILPAGTKLATYSSEWGSTTYAVNENAIVEPLLPNMSVGLSVTATPIQASAPQGSSAGVINITSGNRKISTSPIATNSAFTSPSLAWKLIHPTKVI
jgi:D-alanyl-D-alanine carboxypeptidase (penicillin-binding protein 5/6)